MQIKTIHIEFTTKCNSKCTMCDYWRISNPKTINGELVFNAVSELVPRGLKKIYFTGGECLLFADELFELCIKIRTAFPQLDLGLITNGLLLTKYYHDVAELFSKVIISLDTVNPVIYKKIRGIAGLDKVKRGIHLLKESSSQMQVNLRVLVLNENVSDLPNIIEYAIQEHLNRISFLPEDTSSEIAFGRTEGTHIEYNRQEVSLPLLKSIIDKIRSDYASELGRMLRHSCNDLDYIYSVYSGKTTCLQRCNKASTSCVIGADGLVSPCFFISGKQSISDNNSIIDVLSDGEYCQTISDIDSHRYPVCYTCACPKELS